MCADAPRECSVWLLDRALEWWPLCGEWSRERRGGSAGGGGGGQQVVPKNEAPVATSHSSSRPSSSPQFAPGHELQQSDAVHDYVRLLLVHLGLPEWPQLAARAALLAASSHLSESLAPELPAVSPTALACFIVLYKYEYA